ncbi:hypothetical protein DFS34DRAFT_164167 [Phlyctochytrium arcticum]|nr:hypothetical protein DFS34DRAFT_164167 [Phlyctochytrium arcticum]
MAEESLSEELARAFPELMGTTDDNNNAKEQEQRQSPPTSGTTSLHKQPSVDASWTSINKEQLQDVEPLPDVKGKGNGKETLQDWEKMPGGSEGSGQPSRSQSQNPIIDHQAVDDEPLMSPGEGPSTKPAFQIPQETTADSLQHQQMSPLSNHASHHHSGNELTIVESNTSRPESRNTNASVSTRKEKPEDSVDKSYRLKPITFHDPVTHNPRDLKIVTQNRNGPCPLLALCNVLLLRGEIFISQEWEEVSYENLIMLLGEWLTNRLPTEAEKKGKTVLRASSENLDIDFAGGAKPVNKHLNHVRSDLDDGTHSAKRLSVRHQINPNFDQNLTDVLEILPTLQTGLDVNVRFDSPFSFEFSPSLLVFDIFSVKLCHGWTVDPQDEETYRVVVTKCGSYNHAVETIIQGEELSAAVQKQANDTSTEGQPATRLSEADEQILHDSLVCRQFLDSTASQLTYHGLMALSESLPPNTFTVLFRNNHFHTLYKRVQMDGTISLYTLVTDQGFVHADGVVWERMENVEGDSTMCDGNGMPINQNWQQQQGMMGQPYGPPLPQVYHPPVGPALPPNTYVDPSLHPRTQSQTSNPPTSTELDRQLAMSIHMQEEQQQYLFEQARLQSQGGGSSSRGSSRPQSVQGEGGLKKKKDKCLVM